MNVIQISSQILILSISLILSINLVNGFNVCNVEINNLDSAFIVNDTQYNNEILIVDSSGNLYLHGRDRYLLNYNTQNSLYLSDSLFFNRITSKFNNILENQVTFPQTNSLLIKDSNEEIVASFSSSNNNIYLKGKAAVQGEQAGCLPDGNYCNDNNNDILESRDYFCNLIGYKEGSCEYTVLSTQSCSSNDYFFCSGNNRHKMEYSCSGGSGSASCVGSPRFIQTCTYAPSTRTSSWSCSSSSTRSRTITTYSPTCSSGSCSYTSSRSTQRQNCGSGRHCSRGSCVRSRFAYEAEWRYVDGPHAGRGVRGSHRTHTANAPFSNAVCYTSTGAFRKGWIRWWPPGGAHVRCYIWGHRYI